MAPGAARACADAAVTPLLCTDNVDIHCVAPRQVAPVLALHRHRQNLRQSLMKEPRRAELPTERRVCTALAGIRGRHAPEPSMTSVSTTTVTDPSSVNTESAGVENAESSQGGKPAQPEPGKDLTAEEEALLQSLARIDSE